MSVLFLLNSVDVVFKSEIYNISKREQQITFYKGEKNKIVRKKSPRNGCDILRFYNEKLLGDLVY